jgi:predicted DNA-binding transcriptional regulator AlpA
MKIDGIAKIFDCVVDHAYKITQEPGFPEPFKIVGRVKHWEMRDVLAWKVKRVDRRKFNGGAHK